MAYVKFNSLSSIDSKDSDFAEYLEEMEQEFVKQRKEGSFNKNYLNTLENIR